MIKDYLCTSPDKEFQEMMITTVASFKIKGMTVNVDKTNDFFNIKEIII